MPKSEHNAEGVRTKFAHVEGSMSEELMTERRAEANRSAESVQECKNSLRADGKHSWAFDGDDPYIYCHFCGELRDALTGRVIA